MDVSLMVGLLIGREFGTGARFRQGGGEKSGILARMERRL